MHTHGPISLDQARALVTALYTANTEAQRAKAWPDLLRPLTTWALQLHSHGRTQGSQTKRPLRPWERQQQQQQQEALQQQGQQQAHAQLQLLQQALQAVVTALQDAAAVLLVAPPLVTASSSAAATAAELFAIAGPALAFLGAAVTALAAAGADVHQQLQESAVAAACVAIAAVAGPALLAAVDGQSVLQEVLWGYEQLVLACKDNPTHICWLLSCLLASLRDALQTRLSQLTASASISCPAAATLGTLQDWAAQQTQEMVAAAVTRQLAGLYTLGHTIGIAVCQTAAAAATAGPKPSQMQQQLPSEVVVLQGLAGMSGLLHAACSATVDPATVAVSGAVAAGLLGGCIEALPQPSPAAAAAATAAGSLGDVWGSTAADATKAAPQQQQQQHAPNDSAILEPEWHQHIQQQQVVLLQALEMACQQCLQPAAASTAVGHHVLSTSCHLLLGYAFSRLMASHNTAVQQMHLQQQSHAGLQCSLAYILHQCCGLSGVMHHAGCCADAAAANKWLAAQQQQHPPHEVGVLVRWLADAVSSSDSKQQLLLQAVRAEAEVAANSYDCYLRVAKPEVLQQVDASAVRQQLDRLFATAVSVLTAAWQQKHQLQQTFQESAAASQQQLHSESAASTRGNSSSSTGRPSVGAVVAQGLAAIAALQFCQVQLPAYVDLLRSLVGALASSNAAADAFLSTAMPCYDALVHAAASDDSNSSGSKGQCDAGSPVDCECHSSSSSSQPTTSRAGSSAGNRRVQPWLDSPVLIARLNFLLPLIPVACKAASDQAIAVTRVLPLVLLLLPHPVRQLSDGAHAAFAGLLTAATDTSAAAAAGSADVLGQQQQSTAAFDVMQQAVPFYLERSLQGLPSSGSLEGLAVGFSCPLKQLPAGNVMSLLAVRKVTDRTMELAVQAAAEGHQMQSQHAPPAPQRQQSAGAAVRDAQNSADSKPASNAAAAAARLFELVQLSVQLLDYQLLPSVLQHITAAVTAAPAGVQQQWVRGLYSSCIAVDDYARKPALIAWIDGLNKTVVQAWRDSHQAVTAARKGSASRIGQAQGDVSSNAASKPAQAPFLIA